MNFGNFGGLSDEAKRQIADVTNTLNAQIKLLDSYSFTRATTSRSRGGSSSSKSSESDAAKAAEEAYKKRLVLAPVNNPNKKFSIIIMI